MLEGGFFLSRRGSVSGSGGYEDVYLDDGEVVFSPLDPIYVDEDENVYYSKENKNAYMYTDSNGNVFVKVVK